MKKFTFLILSLCASLWGATLMPWSHNFEGDDSTCWASRPNGDENSAGCDSLTNIGKGSSSDTILREGRFGVSHSSPNAVKIAYYINEQESRFRFNGINSDSVYIGFWCYIKTPYDYAFGEKFLRAVSTDSVGINGCASGSLFWDHIGYIRNCTQTPGVDAMCSFTLEPNGGSGDFGSANYAFPENQWFFFQVFFKNNTPGGSNGVATVWVNDSVIIHSTGLSNMRTSNRGANCTYDPNTNNTLITQVTGGGWWSNNPGTNPAVVSQKYEDDYCVQATKCPMTAGAPVITVDPSNAIVQVPRTTSFSIAATGATSYQWQRGTTNVSTGSGGTTATYTIPASAYPTDNGSTYRCIASNASGADTSAAATLTVRRGSRWFWGWGGFTNMNGGF